MDERYQPLPISRRLMPWTWRPVEWAGAVLLLLLLGSAAWAMLLLKLAESAATRGQLPSQLASPVADATPGDDASPP